ncbi:MAG TPA: NAD-dependent epimerase/dehydratase family protein [Luteibacter sp.]|uniref:NAD-dependent epimerase/dehydratase family protein n=1 Tax=Luteibacter sp. TaxID=1886636 RepID=UPI002CC50880|nr:NAD-dependent epimerase/dehydratase family protein [Luteibacter sp.]HVI53544.1 NAD-dependent epimerase/dehydratase family protein [Luteibacter sp.]
MQTTTKRTALVLGATGGVGGATTQALLDQGWRVKALSRRAMATDSAIQWIKGDAMNAADVLAAAAGVQVIVHAVNPPGYRDWETQVLPMMDNTIAAARAVDARIVIFGSVYNYGEDATPLVHEESPQHAPTRKGEIRVELERRLEAAARDGVRSLNLRCGDFYGPHAGSSWFAQGLVKPGKPLRAMQYPGSRELGHTWAYLPDVAATTVALLGEEERLDTFARFHFNGHYVTGDALHAAVCRASKRPTLPLRAFPWPLVTLASPFSETLRELRKMRYLWRTPIELDGTRLRTFLGTVPTTPLEAAVQQTLAALGVIQARPLPH